jgi:large repetitive protein
MKATHRSRAAARALRRILPASVLVGLTLVLSAPGTAFALFSATPSAQTAGVTAATIAAPARFTATAEYNNNNEAYLSWTAPATLTGYTLTQSPGTLAGCSGTPSASTTFCTATGLSAGTTYTWTLTAVYNDWQSPSVQASATTSGNGG